MKLILSAKTNVLAICTIIITSLISCKGQNELADYKGTPFTDSVYNQGAQKIPGRLQCEYYDLGGEGIAYHDSDTINSGSGALNKADGTYLHEFRIHEAVDISYTKYREPAIDNNDYNFVDPEENDLYIGWTEPGEWIKYTIDVEKKGTYALSIMYTANKNAKIALSINDKIVADSIVIASTFVKADTIAFRQWHHWNYQKNIASLKLEKGLQTFTIHTVETGNMNYNYIDFKLID